MGKMMAFEVLFGNKPYISDHSDDLGGWREQNSEKLSKHHSPGSEPDSPDVRRCPWWSFVHSIYLPFWGSRSLTGVSEKY